MAVTEVKIGSAGDERSQRRCFCAPRQLHARKPFRNLGRKTGVDGRDRRRDPAFGSVRVGWRLIPLQAIKQHSAAVVAADPSRKHGDKLGEG
jgi:hypothetical protein